MKWHRAITLLTTIVATSALALSTPIPTPTPSPTRTSNGVRPTSDPSQLTPLPPELRLMDRSKADNITLPSPPTTIPLTPPSPVPTPMDLSISYSLSSSCLLYLTSVLSSTTFSSCLPFSLLLTTSTSYAKFLSASLASGNLTTINELIAYTSSPQPSNEQCDTYFSSLLSAMSSKGNCGADLGKGTDGKPIALEAQAGIGGYKLMRQAAGLTDPDTGVYCYLEAVAASQPDDLYLWSLPAGLALPSTIKPTCSKCSSLLLNHFSESLNLVSTLNGTLLSQAINTVNGACGATFAAYSAASTGGAVRPSLSLSILGLIGGAIGLSIVL